MHSLNLPIIPQTKNPATWRGLIFISIELSSSFVYTLQPVLYTGKSLLNLVPRHHW